jgi:TorA maturation chaperone TorD
MRDANQEELQVRLGVDRARLLRGVKRGYGPPPPYESIYRGGEVVMGDAALGAKGFYAALGYHLPHGCNEPPDYIGLELDFMRFLCQEEAGGWNTQSHGRALECQTWEREFLYKHVVEWVPVFCAEMFADAREDFYRGMAQLTRAFVVLDAEGLRSQDTRDH